MKDFFKATKAIFKYSRLGTTIRMAVISAILVYIMLVTAFLPTFKAYSLNSSISEKEEEWVATENNQNSNLENLSQEEFLDQDRYKNTWNNEDISEAYVVNEEVELRTETDKHFKMSDGSYSLMSFASQIHYLTADGKFEEIDNTFIKSGKKYKNKSNFLQVEIPESYTKGGKTYLTVGNYELSFRLENHKLDKIKKIDNKINKHALKSKGNHIVDLYNESGIYFASENNDIELEQLLVGTTFKENIIVKSPLSSYEFIFDIKTKGLNLHLDEKGNILATADNKVIMKIPKGYMFDANNVYSNDVVYELISKPSGYTLKIIADSDYMNSYERVFPITIDPTVEVPSYTGSTKNIYTAGRERTNDNVIYKEGGRLVATKEKVAFLNFNFPEVAKNSTIISANLNFYAGLGSGTKSTLSVWENGYAFNEDVPPERIIIDYSSLIPNTYLYGNIFDAPTYEGKADHKLLLNSTAMSQYSIDVTKNLKRIADFNESFYGFAFIGDSNTANINIATETYSTTALRPSVQIRYRNIIGIEGYWDYDQYSAGNNNIYINRYNDEMTVVHDDAAIASELPINLQHVFMSAHKEKQYNIDGLFNNSFYGLGWKLNYQQAIRAKGSNFEYYDADGTMHYFYYNKTLSEKLGQSVAEDEDGLGLKIYNLPGSYKMVDLNKNESYFDYHGRLYKISDRNGNITNILYGNGNQPTISELPITEINDGQGNKLTLTYNTSKFLTKITYKRADGTTSAEVQYSYVSNKLDKITNDDGTFSKYHYETSVFLKQKNNIVRVQDESNNSIKFELDEAIIEDAGLDNPQTDKALLLTRSKLRRVYRSADGINWILIKDTIYCGGLTLVSIPEEGKTYVPPYTMTQYREDVRADVQKLYPDVPSDQIKYLLADILVMSVTNKATYKLNSYFYQISNFREKSVYDVCGRLYSSYIDERDSITTIDFQYENASSTGINVNNNKLKASATYNPSIVNNVVNGSFKNGTANWIETSSIGSVYKYALVSQKYSAQGANSLGMFVAQPTIGEYEVSQRISVDPGTYTITAYIRVENILVPNNETTEYGAFIRMGGSARTEYVTADIFTTDNRFKKVSATYTFNSRTSFYVDCVIKNCAGTVYFDGIQVAKNNFGEVDLYNNAINAGFEYWDGTLPNDWSLWTSTGVATSNLVKKAVGYNERIDGNNAVKLTGAEVGSVNLFQQIPIAKSSQSTAYTFAVWANTKGRIYNNSQDSLVALNYRLFDKNMTPLGGFNVVPITIPYAIWHQVSATFIAPPETCYVELNIQIRNSTTELLLDNISLVKSEVINLLYDSRGNNSYYSDGQNDYLYNEEGNKVTIKKDGNEQYGIVKDEKGNVVSSSDINRKVKSDYTYDAKGRITSEVFSSYNGGKKISSSTTYQKISNNLIDSITDIDSLGFKTINNSYSFSGLLAKTIFNDKSYIEYVYSDNATATSQSTAFPKEVKYIKIFNKSLNGTVLSTVVYRYFTATDALTSSDYGHRHIGSLYSVTMDNGTVYSYAYDKWGNTTNVKLNGNTQITYNYRELDNVLLQKTLSNGYSEKYFYDRLGRIVEVQTRRNATSPFESKYSYSYTVSGKDSTIKDHMNGLKYSNQYDINGRLIWVGEADINSYDYKKFDEYIYDRYGDFVTKNTIDKNSNNFSLPTPSAISLSGSLTHSRTSNTEVVNINGTKRITYTYNTADLKTSYITREDNTLLRNSTYPNGVTILYKRDQRGKLTGYDIYKLNTTNVSPSYTYGLNNRTNTYDFDQGSEDLWDIEWLKNNQPANNSYPVTKLADTEYNGEKITNIMRVHHGSVYADPQGNFSLVNPNALKNYTGMEQIGFWARQEAIETGAIKVLLPRLMYTDGTASQQHQLIMNTQWQYFTIDIDLSKTPKALILPWYNGQWLNIGNFSIYGKKQLWDSEFAIENQTKATTAPVTKMPAEIYNGTHITDIIRFTQASYYDTSYYSLVDPTILAELGENFKINYWIKKETVGSSIGGLFLRYSDGSYSEIPQLANNSNWQNFTITSNPNKKVIGVQLENKNSSWMKLGNVVIESNNIGRNDNRLTGERLINGTYTEYEYDDLGRQAEVNIKVNPSSVNSILKDVYTFMDGADNNTSFNVTSKAITYGANNGITYNYTYCMDNPSLGTIKAERANPYNIWQIKEGTTVKVQYNYDTLGRLIREDNRYINKTITYEYDGNNNITRKTEYPINMGGTLSTTGTVKTYTYGNSTYKDRLTSYNGSAITYDSFGNPTNYMGKTMSWYGRELESITYGASNITYKYDYNGLRLSKTNNGTKTSYRYEGSKLLSETKGSDKIWYLYNDLGIAGIEINGTSYYYLRNLTGDVTKLIDSNGIEVVEYTYDSWGKLISTTGTQASTIGLKNPIRYRGYYYDTDTSLYYLQSRYYDPETGRFISTDIIEVALDSGEYNLYAYCGNNPVMMIDDRGTAPKWWQWTLFGVGAALVVTAAVVLTVGSGGAAAGLIGAVAVGAAKGALIGAAVGSAVGIAGGAIHSASTGADMGDSILQGFLIGFGGGAIVGAVIGGFGSTATYNPAVGFGGKTVGIKTPGNAAPYSRYVNTKSQTITVYNKKGLMSWSKHLTNHGNSKMHPHVPHWHMEMPHSKEIGNQVKFVFKLIKRMFGGN